MPAKFSFSFSTRWKLARLRRDDFPACPDFPQLESGRGSNFVSLFCPIPIQLDRAVRYRRPWRQKTKSPDSDFQRASLQLTAKRLNVPSLNCLAASPQSPCTSTVGGVLRVKPRIRFHVARISGTLDRFYQRHDAPTVGRCAHCHIQVLASIAHHWPMLDWPKTTSHA
jgi:hypothetical protein